MTVLAVASAAPDSRAAPRGTAIVTASDPVIAAAGDIACDPGSPSFNGGLGTATSCRQRATSDLILDQSVFPQLDLVLPLGDLQYEDGAYTKFQASYDPSWGRLKALTTPTPGNHEYGTTGAAGYYQYFGSAAGDPTKGYYSLDLGNWHLISLNSNCSAVGGCGVGSPQEQWLRADLATSGATCVLAYWHQPRFSSGNHGSDATYDAFWRALYSAGADVVLSGHDHSFERFSPQTPDGLPDARGIREFVVGTGGNGFYAFSSPQPNSEVRISHAFGVLKLTLQPTSYTWEFVKEDRSILDSGSGSCSQGSPPSSVFVSDQFERTVASGFGTADVGGGWSVSDAGKTKVAGGEGVISGWTGGNQDVRAWTSATAADMEVLALIRLNPTNPTGAAYQPRVVARAQSDARNGYSARIVHTTSGGLTWGLSRVDNAGGTGTVSLGAGTLITSGAAGTSWWIRLRVQGTSIQARYWQNGSPEPATWKVSATDSYWTSGRASLGAYVSSGLASPYPNVGFPSLLATAIG